MNCGVPVRDLGPLATPVLAERVRALPDAAWDADPYRQERYAVHRATRSVRWVWTDLASWPAVEPRFLPALEPFEGALHRVFQAAGRRLGRPITLMNAVLARLDPGGAIPEHVDSAPFFGVCHRLHLPLWTHPDATLTVGGAPFHLQAGHLYEINNRMPHAAHNAGDAPRIHLILDVAGTVPP